jgi:hypothetical protein
MVMLDSASLGPPPRSTSRAFNNRSECYSMRFGAATDRELLMASQARRRRTLKGKRTLMSNAPHHRAREWHWWNYTNCASRAPVHVVVRQLAWEKFIIR